MGGSGGGGPLGVKSTSEDIGGWYARSDRSEAFLDHDLNQKAVSAGAREAVVWIVSMNITRYLADETAEYATFLAILPVMVTSETRTRSASGLKTDLIKNASHRCSARRLFDLLFTTLSAYTVTRNTQGKTHTRKQSKAHQSDRGSWPRAFICSSAGWSE